MRRLIFIASILLLTAVLTAPFSVSAAEQPRVKPGSFFYGFVTTFEKVNLFFTFNPEKKAEKALKYAEKRLAEAEAVAGDKNSDAVKTAISGYEKNIALAAEASKKVKDEAKAEKLLNLIADNTSKHQQILADVLSKVPDEAKEAITKAIDASKKGQEEALKQVAELKGEVEKLKQELAELKAKDSAKPKAVEETNKQKPESVSAPVKQPAPSSQTPTKTEGTKTTSITTLPNGAVVEMDAGGNIIRTIKEAQQLDPVVQILQQIQQDVRQIQQNTTPSPSPPPSPIPAPMPTPVSQAKIDLGFAWNDSGSVVATGWNKKEIYAQVYGDKGDKLTNVRINVTTPDASQDKTIDYARGGSYNGVPSAFWIDYYPKFAGNHTIAFSVPSYGLTKSISFEATPYTPLVPKAQFTSGSPTNVVMSKNGDDKIIAVIEIRPNEDDWSGLLRLDKISYHLISNEFSPAQVDYDSSSSVGVEVNICFGGSCLNPNHSHLSNGVWYANRDDFSGSGIRSIGAFSLRAFTPKTLGKFKISIDSLEYIGERSGNIYIPANLPLITPEIEVK